MPRDDRTLARRRAHRAGHGAEWVAILLLWAKGYRILARRYLVKGGEIDVVARRGRTIAFVEVKLRASLDDAMIAIAPAKRRRMARAARVFVSRQRAGDLTYRADAIFLSPWRWPLHIPAAFELDLD
jgi:putative endonuclease